MGPSVQPCRQYFKCWNTCVKLVNDVPRSTYTYLMEGYVARDQTSLRTQVLSRSRKLLSSPSKEVKMLVKMVSKDPRSTTFKNLKYLSLKTGIEQPHSYGSWKVREALPVQKVPMNEMCRLGLLAKLMEMEEQFHGGEGQPEDHSND